MADEMINSYVALDLETTGIGARHEKITEIGMVKVIDGEAVDTYHTMVNPHREIPERIVELTGITDDMVKDAPGIEEILDEVLAFTEDLPLLGHQIIFGAGLLSHPYLNLSAPVPPTSHNDRRGCSYCAGTVRPCLSDARGCRSGFRPSHHTPPHHPRS